MKDFKSRDPKAPWYSYRERIQSVVIENGVASIGAYAFYGGSMTSVTIPDSVTLMAANAFCECYELKSAGPAGGGYNIEFGWTDRIIENAFAGSTRLKSVTIPDGVTSIGDAAFDGCTDLISVTIPDSVTTIGRFAFLNCGLHSVTLPDGVASIGGGAFEGCHNLTGVTIPSSVTSIEGRTFWGCRSLSSVAIPDSVTSIGVCAFERCGSLTGITIPNSVASIGDSAFCDCESLTGVTLPDAVSIGDEAFRGCRNLACVTIPNGVSSISTGAFMDCESLTSVTLPDSVTSIGSWAFEKCALTGITIPEGVTSIGTEAFHFCNFTSITIPGSVTYIGEGAFSGCYDLSDVYYSGTKAQWAAIAIGSANDPLTNAVIHCNSAGPGKFFLQWTSGADAVITVSNPDGILDEAIFYAAAYDDTRKMTDIAFGRLEESEEPGQAWVTFDKTLNPGWKLYILAPGYSPLCPSVILPKPHAS